MKCFTIFLQINSVKRCLIENCQNCFQNVKKNSPEYILLEHEMNIHIAQAQARPVYFSVLMTIVGIIFGWLLVRWQPL